MREGLPNLVYWVLVALFVLAAGATAFRVFLYARATRWPGRSR